MPSKIRIGIMSTARITKTVVPQMIASEHAEVVAVASRSFNKARSFADEFGIADALDAYDKLLDDSRIDAVYIPLPPSMHCEWTIKAAAAGKHILCEKPLAVDARQAQQMIDAAIQHDPAGCCDVVSHCASSSDARHRDQRSAW